MNLPSDNESLPVTGPPLPLLFRSMDAASDHTDVSPDAILDEPRIDPEQIAQAAREQGIQEGLAQHKTQLEALVEQERQSIARALEEFVREKQRYFAGLEKEVVRLSLAIAEKILHRETGMDPMLLAGAARVALEQVSDDSEAVLRVAGEDVAAWTMMMQQDGRAVAVRGDSSLRKGECLLETANGTFELGVKAQLEEIEHGFFQLLSRNPAMAV